MQRLELPNLETPSRSHQLVPAARRAESAGADQDQGWRARIGIFFWTGIISCFWLGGGGAFLSGYIIANQRDLPTAEIIGLVFLLFLPVFLFWFLAIVIHYALTLRQSSQHLSMLAHRLTEPEKTAAEDVVQLGLAVRTQLDALNVGIEAALSKIGKIEEDVYQYSDNLSQTATNAEQRLDEIKQRLESERQALASLSQTLEEKGGDVSAALQKQTKSLKDVSDKTFEQIEAADHQLKSRIELLTSATEAAAKASSETEIQLEQQYSKLQMLSDAALTRAGDIAHRYELQRESINDTSERLSEENTKLESSLESQRALLDQIGQLVASQAKQIENSVALSAKELEATVISAAARAAELGEDLGSQAQSVKASGEEVTEAMTRAAHAAQAAAQDAQKTIDERVGSITDEIDAAFAAAEAVAQRSQEALAQRVQAIAADIEAAGGTMEGVVQRTEQSLAQQIKSIADHIEAASSKAANVAQQSRQTFAEHAQSITDDIESASTLASELTKRTQSQLSKRLVEATQSIKAASSTAEGLVERSRLTFTEQAKAITQDFETSGAKMDELAEKAHRAFKQRAEKLKSGVAESGEAAEKVSSEAQAKLETQLRQIRTQITQTGDVVDTATEKLAGTIDRILEASSEASEQLEGAVLDLEARLAEFPDHAKETTYSIRKVIEDQISVFTEITDEAAEKARTLDAALQAKLKINREALRGLLSYLDLDNVGSMPAIDSNVEEPKAITDGSTSAPSPGDTSPPPAVAFTSDPEPSLPEETLEKSESTDATSDEEDWRQRADLQPNGDTEASRQAEGIDEAEQDAIATAAQMPGATKPRVTFRPPTPEDVSADERPEPDPIIGDVINASASDGEDIDGLTERLTERLRKIGQGDTGAANTAQSPRESDDNSTEDASDMPHVQQSLANQLRELDTPEHDASLNGSGSISAEPAAEDGSTGDDGAPLRPSSTHPPMGGKRGWKWRDILAAADNQANDSLPATNPKTDEIPRTSLQIIETLQAMTVDLDRALEDDPPVELVRRYLNGERNLFARRIAQQKQEEMLERIQSKYKADGEFRENADRYLTQFEELLTGAREEDRDNILAETYLSSDTGKVYLLIADALGRKTS